MHCTCTCNTIKLDYDMGIFSLAHHSLYMALCTLYTYSLYAIPLNFDYNMEIVDYSKPVNFYYTKVSGNNARTVVMKTFQVQFTCTCTCRVSAFYMYTVHVHVYTPPVHVHVTVQFLIIISIVNRYNIVCM